MGWKKIRLFKAFTGPQGMKELGPAEKPSRGHPRMLFLQAQHLQIDPLD